MKNRFFIVFIMLLVVSITPVSASLRSDLSNELSDTNTKLEQGTNGNPTWR